MRIIIGRGPATRIKYNPGPAVSVANPVAHVYTRGRIILLLDREGRGRKWASGDGVML